MKTTTTTDQDWDLIVAHLHPTLGKDSLLSLQQKITIWRLGDGYGRLSLKELRELDLLFDWSHIRDSGPTALAHIAAIIREYLDS